LLHFSRISVAIFVKSAVNWPDFLLYTEIRLIRISAEEFQSAIRKSRKKIRLSGARPSPCHSSAHQAGIDWLEFNGTFSTVRLYRAFRSYSLRLRE